MGVVDERCLNVFLAGMFVLIVLIGAGLILFYVKCYYEGPSEVGEDICGLDRIIALF